MRLEMTGNYESVWSRLWRWLVALQCQIRKLLLEKKEETDEATNLGPMNAGFKLTNEGGVPSGLSFASSMGSEIGWTTVTQRKKRDQHQSKLKKKPPNCDL